MVKDSSGYECSWGGGGAYGKGIFADAESPEFSNVSRNSTPVFKGPWNVLDLPSTKGSF